MIPNLWRAGAARAALRLPLLLPAGVYRAASATRSAWHAARERRPLARPSVVVGNLSVGGTGKTPVAAWCAGRLAALGCRPGVLVHPAAGEDEAAVHAALTPGAVVVVGRDRRRAGARAASLGAEVLVLDDGLQHRAVRPELRLVILAAEQAGMSRWPLPAGPWREPIRAAAHADFIVITRKTASSAEASRMADRMARTGVPVLRARLALGGFQRLRSGEAVPLEAVAGRRVLAVAGVADPVPFGAVLARAGARVRLRPMRDHARYSARSIRRLLDESRSTDYVVVTLKDAMKLRTRWPAEPDPLVAELVVRWEVGETALRAALARLTPRARADSDFRQSGLPIRQ